MGSGNSAASITTAALNTYKAIRAGSPAPIIVFGVFGTKVSGDYANLSTIENAIASAVAQFNDPKAFFNPLHQRSGDAVGDGLLDDTFKSGLSNEDYLIGGDTVHPGGCRIGLHRTSNRTSNPHVGSALPELIGPNAVRHDKASFAASSQSLSTPATAQRRERSAPGIVILGGRGRRS